MYTYNLDDLMCYETNTWSTIQPPAENSEFERCTKM